MKRMEKYIPSLLLAIVLVFSLIGLEGAVFAKKYLLNPETYIENVQENDVDSKVMTNIEKYFKSSYDYSGIPEDVYMAGISKDDIQNMINDRIYAVFDYIDGTASEIAEKEYDFSALETSLSDYFAEFAEENNVEIDDAYNQQLQKTIDTAESEITNFTDVYMLKAIEKTGAFSKLRKLYGFVDPIIYAIAGIALLCIIIIFIMSIKNFLYWLSISVLCSSVIAFVPCMCIRFSGYIKGLVIRNDYIYAAVTGMLNSTLNKYIALQAALIALGIVLAAIYIIIYKKKIAGESI